jgi:proteic killer suppression protein
MESVIKTFASRATEMFWTTGKNQGMPRANVRRVALRKLVMVDDAADLKDLEVPPGNHLEALHGNREGQYSIRINDQFRICFSWREGNAYAVEIVDYH